MMRHNKLIFILTYFAECVRLKVFLGCQQHTIIRQRKAIFYPELFAGMLVRMECQWSPRPFIWGAVRAMGSRAACIHPSIHRV